MGVMDNINNLLVRLRLRKPKPQLSREQAMGARPVRNPSLPWKVNDEGNVVVTLPRRGDLAGKALGWLFMVPEQKPIELDELGSVVWHHCDGQYTVREIVEVLAAKYKLNRQEVDLTLTEYLRMLGKRGMVGFMIDRKIAEEAGVAGQEIIGLEEVATTEQQLAAAEQQAAEAAAETRRILAEMEQSAGELQQDQAPDAPEPADDPEVNGESRC